MQNANATSVGQLDEHSLDAHTGCVRGSNDAKGHKRREKGSINA